MLIFLSSFLMILTPLKTEVALILRKLWLNTEKKHLEWWIPLNSAFTYLFKCYGFFDNCCAVHYGSH